MNWTWRPVDVLPSAVVRPRASEIIIEALGCLGLGDHMNTFLFGNQAQGKAAHRAEVPAKIQTKAALLDAISEALRFPDYFGGNWDALEECVRDLSWLPGGDVILSHEDLPLSQDLPSLSTYLAILKDAGEKWNATGERKLLVIFPPETESIVQRVLYKT